MHSSLLFEHDDMNNCCACLEMKVCTWEGGRENPVLSGSSCHCEMKLLK